MDITKVVVVPVFFDPSGYKIVLVTSREKKLWILPKGNVEKKLSRKESALLEAYEEAGLKGKIMDFKPMHFIRQGEKHAIYLMKVKKLLHKWPEYKDRKRMIVSPAKAQKMLDDKNFKKYAKKLLKKFEEEQVS